MAKPHDQTLLQATQAAEAALDAHLPPGSSYILVVTRPHSDEVHGAYAFQGSAVRLLDHTFHEILASAASGAAGAVATETPDAAN